MRKVNKDIPVYLFSSLPDDESSDSIKPKRIILDDSWIDDPIDIEEFADTDVIFDDTDVLTNKKIREEVYKIMNQGLEIGRHYRINMVITNHLPSKRKDTRRVLYESSSFTYFPHSANQIFLRKLCWYWQENGQWLQEAKIQEQWHVLRISRCDM